MKPVILILTPATEDERYIARKGDLFDTAFVETVRTLDGQGEGATVLVPWTVDLAALVAAATIDTASVFDPEAESPSGRTRSRLLAYLLPGDLAPEPDSPFWRASHLSLDGGAAAPFEAAARKAPPTHVVVLGPPKRSAVFRNAMRESAPRILTFGSLVSAPEAAELLGASIDRVVDLEGFLPAGASEEEAFASPEAPRERSDEADLEPYVPFGLLLQNALDAFLDDSD